MRYAIIGLTKDKQGLGNIKRHFGTIEWIARSTKSQSININFTNSRGAGTIYQRNKRIFEKIVKLINEEYSLEDLSVILKSKSRYTSSHRKTGRNMPKTK